MFEKALENAKKLLSIEDGHLWKIQISEIYHNLGTCWERLHEHHSALTCYENAEKLRRQATMPDVSIRRKKMK